MSALSTLVSMSLTGTGSTRSSVVTGPNLTRGPAERRSSRCGILAGLMQPVEGVVKYGEEFTSTPPLDSALVAELAALGREGIMGGI